MRALKVDTGCSTQEELPDPPGPAGVYFRPPKESPSPATSLWFFGVPSCGLLPLNLACGAGTFTLGVLGPCDCDPTSAQALRSVAAQPAVYLANQDSSLMLVSVVLPTGCDACRALATFLDQEHAGAAFVGPVNTGYCPAAALLAQGWGNPPLLGVWGSGGRG